MSNFNQLLLDGEHVVYRTNLHWVKYIAPLLLFVLGMALCIFFLDSTTKQLIYIGYAVMVIAFVFFAVRWIQVRSNEFVVTNRRVIIKTGVFNQIVKDIRLSKSDGIMVQSSFIGRIFGYGDLIVSSTGGEQNVYQTVNNPQEFRRQINKAADAVQAAEARQQMRTQPVQPA